MSEFAALRASRLRPAWLFALVGAAALNLAGCDKSDNRTAGQKVDDAIAKTEHAADQAAARTGQAVKDARAKLDSSDAASRLSEATQDAGKAIASAADDATITAAVTAGLAKDPDLSALKINVDTHAGKVTLRGPAPTSEAKDRAEQIARDVKGVSSVVNQLELKSM